MGAFWLPLLFALFSHAAALEATEPIKLIAKSITKCECDDDNCMLDMEDMQMTMKEDNQLAFKSKMVIKQNSCDKLSGEILLKYCDRDGKNCFNQEPFPIKDLCAHLDDKNTIWEPIIKKLEELGFLAKCPVKEGDYQMDSVEVSMKSIESYNPEPGRWTGKFVAMCEKKKIFCFEMEVLVEALSGLK